MPGLVKVGRTRTSVDERLKQLYTTGVPGPFVAERQRFFLDYQASEKQFLGRLSKIGERCMDRQFFIIETERASELLEQMYWNQHEEFHTDGGAFDNFGALTTEAFSVFHLKKFESLCEDAARMIEILPSKDRQLCGRSMLAHVLEKKDAHLAKILVQECGINPDVPIAVTILPLFIREYFLTGYELALYFQLPTFIKYLEQIGCSLEDSNALCYVIDALINSKLNDQANIRLVEFAVELISNGVNLEKILNVDCFANAPRSRNMYDFRVFPRNSDISCIKLIGDLAETDQKFSIMHDRISEMF
jgi:hypothetical protein